ncbi:MAG: ferrous iron transport protein B [Leptospiraceae bacterium]|nr:ferrous iron transport protein B [Leptospiraceae bacterium]
MNQRILLVGNPNCGKSTLFNRLTGLKQKTGNFAGVTVEKRSGTIATNAGEIEIIDLPGSYSLNGSGEDKKTLTRFLMNREETDRVVFVLDAILLERSLQFLFQIMDLGIPIFIAITMKDLLFKKNIHLDLKKLEEELGLSSILLNARTGEGIPELLEKISEESNFKLGERIWNWDKTREEFYQKLISKIESESPKDSNFVLSNGLKILSGETLQKELPGLELFTPELNNYIELEFQKEKLVFSYQDELIQKSFKIKEIISKVFHSKEAKTKNSISSKLDSIFLHPYHGMIAFLLIMAMIFQALFSWSEIPKSWIEQFIDSFSKFSSEIIWKGPFNDLVAEGIIKGTGSVLSFVPQIGFLFLFIAILEETGYMARASFMMDKFMGRFGLSGKSFIPLLSSAACAVPAILGARTIEDKKDRIRTILVSPLITCSARYPVYILVIGTIFSDEMIFGFLSIRALVLFGLFFLGMFAALGFALLFKKTFFKNSSAYFLLELPEYRIPTLKDIFYSVYKNVKSFIINSGTVILYVSVVLWFLANYPKVKDQDFSIQDSYAAKIGKSMEPIIEPIGYEWKIGVAVLSSFAAREVMVSTLSILYNTEEDNTNSLREKMLMDENPKTKKKVWNFWTGLSILVFYAFAAQCFSTLAVVRKETGSIFWSFFVFGYMTTLAYVSSFVVYQMGTKFFN